MASKTELAKAYVEIVPSAVGIGGKISEALGGEVSAAGVTAGKNLGGNLVGTLSKVIAAAGIGKMLQSAFDVGSAFETSLAKVGTIADPAKASLAELSDEILTLSGNMHIGASDLAEATYQAISASVDTADAVSFAGDASKLAAAGFTSSSSAVDILTTAINAYGLSADDAAHISDVLLTTQNKGKTTVDELANTLGRVIPLAAAYNVNLENLASSQAIMTANGIAQAESVTYTKSMLNELGDTGSAVGKILQKQTGESFAQLSADGKTLGDVLGILYDSVGNDATKFAALWSSVEAGTGALSLANAGAEKFNEVYTGMVESTGATETAYGKMTDTMQYKMDGLKTSAENLGTALFNNLSGPVGQGVTLASGYLQTLADSFQTGGFAGLAEGLASIFTDLTTNVGPQLLQTGIDLLGQLGQGLVSGIPQLLAQALPMVAELASGLRANAGQLVDAGIQFILNLAQGLMDGLPTMITYIPGIITDIAGIINDNAPKLLEAGVQLILTLGKGLIAAVPTLVANIPQILTAIANVITTFNWVGLGQNIIQFLGNGIKGMAGALTSGFKSVLDGGIAYIKSLPAKFVGWGKDMIMGLVKGITGSVGAVVNAVKNVASAITSYLHFSRPDMGPLRLYERWMPDFMAGLADGITANLWQVEDAVTRLAGVTAQPMQAALAGTLQRSRWPTAADGWQQSAGTVLYQTNTFNTHDSLSESELTRQAEDMAQRLRWGLH